MAKKVEEPKKIKVTLVKSASNALKNQKANVEAMGLRKIGSSNIFVDDACIRGKIAKVSHLVKVEEI